MAVSFGARTLYRVQAASGGPSTPESFSFNSDGDPLIVAVCHHKATTNPPPPTGVTYNSVAMTQAVEASHGGGGGGPAVSLWYLTSPASGSNTVEITWGTDPDSLVVWALNVAGSDTADFIEDTAVNDGGTGNTDAMSLDLSPAAASGMLFLGNIRNAADLTTTPDTGTTELEEAYSDSSPPGFSTDVNGFLGSRIESGSGTYALGATWSASNRYAALAVAINEAAGGLENTITFATGLNDILANLGIFQNAELFRTGLSDTKAPTSVLQAIRSFDLGLAASHLGEILSAAVENTITFALGLAESKVAQSIFNRTISFSTGLAESRIARLILSGTISFGIGLRDTLSSLVEGIVENTITFAVGFAESKAVSSVFASVISFGTGFRDLLNTTGVFNHFITFSIGLRDLLSPSVITDKAIVFATGFAARHAGNIIEVVEGVITFGLGLADNLASTSRRTWELTVRTVSVWRKPDNSK